MLTPTAKTIKARMFTTNPAVVATPTTPTKTTTNMKISTTPETAISSYAMDVPSPGARDRPVSSITVGPRIQDPLRILSPVVSPLVHDVLPLPRPPIRHPSTKYVTVLVLLHLSRRPFLSQTSPKSLAGAEYPLSVLMPIIAAARAPGYIPARSQDVANVSREAST